ncbi:MAG: radical SAM protein [Bacteroidales bacterium]|nr:radical SAM protein [Bacteroidales bacterium]MBN2820629.1 radical SAM protein [Bacteroidales bacterium]
MGTFLFDKIIFGPVASRRLGNSLGINLLPVNKKICNFDCIYCECGLTDGTKDKLPSRANVRFELEKTLAEFSSNNKPIDTITFAGNGEPTLHKDFNGIIDDTFELRNTYFPQAKIALLSNSTTLGSTKIQKAFEKIDQNILKLDSVNPATVELINCPIGKFNLAKTIEILKKLPSPIIQTMFIRGSFRGKEVDNTIEQELVPWLNTLKEINPAMVMIYTIARDTPFETLEKVPEEVLKEIAQRVENLGIETQISA